MLRDCRTTIRHLGRSRAFALGVALTLALGITVPTAVVGLVRSVMYPFYGRGDEEQVVTIHLLDQMRPDSSGLGVATVSVASVERRAEGVLRRRHLFESLMVLVGVLQLRNHPEAYGQTPRSTPASAAQNCVETV